MTRRRPFLQDLGYYDRTHSEPLHQEASFKEQGAFCLQALTKVWQTLGQSLECLKGYVVLWQTIGESMHRTRNQDSLLSKGMRSWAQEQDSELSKNYALK